MGEKCPDCGARVRTFTDEVSGDAVVVNRLPSLHGYVRVVSLPRDLVRIEEQRTPGLYVEHSCGRLNGSVDNAGA